MIGPVPVANSDVVNCFGPTAKGIKGTEFLSMLRSSASSLVL